MTTLSYQQVYQDLNVFGGNIKVHLDSNNNIVSVNGNFVPDIQLSTQTNFSAQDAQNTAVRSQVNNSDIAPMATNAQLVIYRDNMLRGLPGQNHLAYQVVVSNGSDIKQVVFVDAQQGKIIDSISAITDALDRKVYDAELQLSPGPNFPSNPFWVEGNPFPTTGSCVNIPIPGYPTCNQDADTLITVANETYQFYNKLFHRDSIDGNGLKMQGVFSIFQSCPNAFWDTEKVNFCPGMPADDVTGHEFTHGYTQYLVGASETGLIYAWQSGALNEAFSDIFGEAIDLINHGPADTPGGERSDGNCSKLANIASTKLQILSPQNIAGEVLSFGAYGDPPSVLQPISGNIALTTPANGCSAISENLSGKIALINRGTCPFATKITNAQQRGAIGVVIADNVPDSIPKVATLRTNTVTIPVVGIPLSNGNAIRAAATTGTVMASLVPSGPLVDKSYRWLGGEGAYGIGGAARDMFSPNCRNMPTKVSDPHYLCFSSDNGGVHWNSALPNRAFALLSDGSDGKGPKNDDDKNKNSKIKGLGLLKAVHLHYRVLSTYMVPTSNFSDYADALLLSCNDLQGVKLMDFNGQLSNQKINPADCKQVQATIAALELKQQPTQCNFQPLLAKNPPALCAVGNKTSVFADGFESNSGWTISHEGQNPEFTQRDWSIVGNLPKGRSGKGFFAPDPIIGTCAPGGNEKVVLHLDSPLITIPATATNLNLTFEHYIASEPGWDGGNVKVSVNGGAYQIVQPTDFVYNAYNTTLNTVADGSDNPIAGEVAFSGTDQGTNNGSWGRSIINLAPYGATPGSTIRIRFDFGNDGCNGVIGWYLDNLDLYTCQ